MAVFQVKSLCLTRKFWISKQNYCSSHCCVVRWFLVPFSLVLMYTYYHGIIDHSGITFKRLWWQPWQPDCIFHDNHHQYFHVNFGFNIEYWDKVRQIQGAITEMQIFWNCCHFDCINTRKTCDTSLKRKFCGLFGKNFENYENLSYEAEFAFFWQAAELAI